MKRIVMCFPSNGAAAKDVSMHIPLACLAAATLINEHYDVKVYDGRLEDINTLLDLLNDDTILVGISVITSVQIKYGLELAQIVKERGIPTVWGGTHVSLLPEQTLAHPLVDFVVKGDGEKALLTLAKKLESGADITNRIFEEKIDNYDDLPDTPYHLVDVENYVTSIQIQGVRKLPFFLPTAVRSFVPTVVRVILQSNGKRQVYKKPHKDYRSLWIDMTCSILIFLMRT